MSLMYGAIKLWHGLLSRTNVFCFGNLTGALCCVAFITRYSSLYTGPLLQYAQMMAVAMTSPGFGLCRLRGIGLQLPRQCRGMAGASAREIMFKIMGMHLSVSLSVFLGLEHVVV